MPQQQSELLGTGQPGVQRLTPSHGPTRYRATLERAAAPGAGRSASDRPAGRRRPPMSLENRPLGN